MPLKRMKKLMIWSTIVIEGDFAKMGMGKDLDVDNVSMIVDADANVDVIAIIIIDKIVVAHAIVTDAVALMKKEDAPIFTKMQKKS